MKSQQKIRYLHTLPETILIPKGECWDIIDSSQESLAKTIILEENSRFRLYGIRKQDDISLNIIHKWAGSISEVGYVSYASPYIAMKNIIKSRMEADKTESTIHILSLAGNGGEIFLDSAIQISPMKKGIIGKIKERHIFLGSTGRIRAIPALIVHSDDIQTDHALAIERISDEELFYLRSRGFPKNEATMMMIDGAVREVFRGLGAISPEKYEEIVSCAMGNITLH